MILQGEDDDLRPQCRPQRLRGPHRKAHRGAPAARRRQGEIDERIWDLFGEEWAVMFTDLSGFSRGVADFGIIHFLQIIYESQRVLIPCIDAPRRHPAQGRGRQHAGDLPQRRQGRRMRARHAAACRDYNATRDGPTRSGSASAWASAGCCASATPTSLAARSTPQQARRGHRPGRRDPRHRRGTQMRCRRPWVRTDQRGAARGTGRISDSGEIAAP